MQLRIDPQGNIIALYQENLDLSVLGPAQIRRASHVEPGGKDWTVDLSPVGGPRLTGFATRSTAIAAEVDWIESRIL